MGLETISLEPPHNGLECGSHVQDLEAEAGLAAWPYPHVPVHGRSRVPHGAALGLMQQQQQQQQQHMR
jgi:hypothetical protein